MNKVKFRVFDHLTKQFFKNNCQRSGETTEVLMSQEGEIYLREKTATEDKITHEKYLAFPNRFSRSLYTGVRDSNHNKYFFNDIVCFISKTGNRSYGVLIWWADKLAIGSQPEFIKETKEYTYNATDSITESDLHKTDKAGNIYQNANLIMGEI